MRIRNRKVPLPLSSLSPIPLSDPQFSQSTVVQLQLHSIPHQKLLQEPQKDEYFDLQLPSDQLNQPIGGGSEGHVDCFCGAGPQDENKVSSHSVCQFGWLEKKVTTTLLSNLFSGVFLHESALGFNVT